MATLVTGPIENNISGGSRPTQQVSITMVNSDPTNTSTVLIQGYALNGTRTLYVLQSVNLNAGQVFSQTYFANLNGYEFVFTTSGAAAASTEISVWGKSSTGQLVTAHRIVLHELTGTAPL
ncbi:hypothetical protein HUB98_23445 [Paenibacillus barcinonensis]|uniref:Uncharacterized protein n=1 Tax=Paenibacillus barcinonensis TaxID=198119 RepID=A0A2V4UR09_PAEBA|nr:hypothetical protein [Paenibacillus barcinonensis]PYE42677.1 hypothetical protein DFQ00_13522 [Paenibacillus barcinonensis]QKS58882.1 hypothetical protein HUB98_23445 [Paenibacillus barcinonensis]